MRWIFFEDKSLFEMKHFPVIIDGHFSVIVFHVAITAAFSFIGESLVSFSIQTNIGRVVLAAERGNISRVDAS